MFPNPAGHSVHTSRRKTRKSSGDTAALSAAASVAISFSCAALPYAPRFAVCDLNRDQREADAPTAPGVNAPCAQRELPSR